MLSYEITFHELDFVLPPYLELILVSEDGESGDLRPIVPITTLNFICIISSSTVEIKRQFANTGMKELTMKVSSPNAGQCLGIVLLLRIPQRISDGTLYRHLEYERDLGKG